MGLDLHALADAANDLHRIADALDAIAEHVKHAFVIEVHRPYQKIEGGDTAASPDSGGR